MLVDADEADHLLLFVEGDLVVQTRSTAGTRFLLPRGLDLLGRLLDELGGVVDSVLLQINFGEVDALHDSDHLARITRGFVLLASCKSQNGIESTLMRIFQRLNSLSTFKKSLIQKLLPDVFPRLLDVVYSPLVIVLYLLLLEQNLSSHRLLFGFADVFTE